MQRIFLAGRAGCDPKEFRKTLWPGYGLARVCRAHYGITEIGLIFARVRSNLNLGSQIMKQIFTITFASILPIFFLASSHAGQPASYAMRRLLRAFIEAKR
jgi:hypothetical protein